MVKATRHRQIPNKKMNENNDFLPQDYEAPKGNSSYLKFGTGETRFRILSKPIVGWEDWKDNKPLRFKMQFKPDAPIDATKPIKHFWAMIVWDVLAGDIKILQITQKSIQTSILNLTNDADWGAPYRYDIKVVKKGEKLTTEYSVTAVPHKDTPKEILDMAVAKRINLDALWTGADPFAPNDTPTNIESTLPF